MNVFDGLFVFGSSTLVRTVVNPSPTSEVDFDLKRGLSMSANVHAYVNQRKRHDDRRLLSATSSCSSSRSLFPV